MAGCMARMGESSHSNLSTHQPTCVLLLAAALLAASCLSASPLQADALATLLPMPPLLLAAAATMAASRQLVKPNSIRLPAAARTAAAACCRIRCHERQRRLRLILDSHLIMQQASPDACMCLCCCRGRGGSLLMLRLCQGCCRCPPLLGAAHPGVCIRLPIRIASLRAAATSCSASATAAPPLVALPAAATATLGTGTARRGASCRSAVAAAGVCPICCCCLLLLLLLRGKQAAEESGRRAGWAAKNESVGGALLAGHMHQRPAPQPAAAFQQQHAAPHYMFSSL